jgi:prephenate dehydratase/prephenate dehydrogenase
MQKPVIGIIGGKGHMGALFRAFFCDRGLKVIISDLKTPLTNKKVAQTADITIISVPIDKTEKVIKEVISHIPKECAIMDFTSVKTMPVKAMLKGKCEVLGMHPMFGDSNPIPGQALILTPTKKSGKWSEWMEKFLKINQVKIRKMSPNEHDKLMNVAQGLIHFADITFADALRRTKMPTKDLLKLTSKASELKVQLAARIIDQDPGLYGNIQIENPNTLKSLKLYKKAVEELIRIVEKKDLKAFKKYFENSKKFFKSYTKEAFDVSSYLIDKLVQKERRKPKKRPQKPKKSDIAVLGPKNTFTEMAANKYDSKKNKYYAASIDEVFELVEKGKVEKGIVPIENKLEGTIRETLDNLFEKNVRISEEINISINHTLIILPHAKSSDVKTIYSHPQALKQCKKFLKKYFPKATLLSTPSTAFAVEKIITKNNKSCAAIAPKIAAEKERLKILKENIEDEKSNSTTFIVVQKGRPTSKNVQKNCTKTSIAFHFDKDSPGSLFTVFKDFSDASVNMTKIESRPTQAKFGDYIFYLDFEGCISEPKITRTLKKVEKKVAKMKVLGSY